MYNSCEFTEKLPTMIIFINMVGETFCVLGISFVNSFNAF